MKKKYLKLILAIVFLVVCITIYAGAQEKLHWYIQQGKGRHLCECLTRIANKNPAINGITPNIPWKNVLAIKGVREPEWKELDPLKYENFFQKARKFIESTHTIDELDFPFVRWFLPPKDRWVRNPQPISDEEALKIYRDFARRGGKLKVYRVDISDDNAHNILRDFVQYESPVSDPSDWDGYTIQAEPDLTGIHDAGYPITNLGRGFRLLMYKNDLCSFFCSGEYRVCQLTFKSTIDDKNSPYALDFYFCKIDLEVK